MSDYESFPAADPEHGVALEICKVPAGLRFTVHGSSVVSAWVDPKHALTIALSVLKAAGQESVIVPKAYEEVERLGDELTCGSGPEWAGSSIAANPNWLRNKAANCIAIAEWIEANAAREAAEKAEAEAAEKKLADRRDAIATDLDMTHYVHLVASAALAVDRIIELEDKLASHD